MESPGMGAPGPVALGDAVALAAGVAALALAVALAWVSTYVADGGHQLPGAIVAGGDAAMIRLGPVAAAEAPEAPGAPGPPEEKAEEEPGAELGDSGGAPGAERPPDPRSAPGAPPGRDLITVRLKFLNDSEQAAVVRPEDTVGGLKSKLFPGQERQVRLIYRGQLLQDPRRTLRSLRVTDNCVIHCHRARRAAAPPAPGPGPGSGPGSPGPGSVPGSLALPAAALALALGWYCRINYRQLFTAPATASLIAVTVLCSYLAFGLYRH